MFRKISAKFGIFFTNTPQNFTFFPREICCAVPICLQAAVELPPQFDCKQYRYIDVEEIYN